MGRCHDALMGEVDLLPSNKGDLIFASYMDGVQRIEHGES
jgi:hypothetical protein